MFSSTASHHRPRTPINNSIILYRRLKERHPEFIEEIENKGVKYQLFYDNAPRDQTSSARNSVLQAYGGTVLSSDGIDTVRAKIELEIRRLPTATWSWENQSESNKLGDLRQRAVRDHPRTGDTAFFNNVQRGVLAAGSGKIDFCIIIMACIINGCQYGDGSLISRQYLDSALEIIRIMPYSMPESRGQAHFGLYFEGLSRSNDPDSWFENCNGNHPGGCVHSLMPWIHLSEVAQS
ncbi:Clavaminate synthase-like protein [Diaporthe eres]|nr:Clavaminate synthase-like protein [Diaporthe eres]